MGFFAALLAVAGPIAIRVMLALGFTAVTFVGVQAALDVLVATAVANWSAMPAGVIQLASLSGIPQGLSMIFGAYAALFAIRIASGLKKYVLK